ncbi:MAG: permease prefix domain 2-containing transporter [Acidobacteriota bacterium]
MRFRPSTEPPRLAVLLLALLTPAADRRYLLSDLQEDYDRWVGADGTEAARRRYWRQVRDSFPPLLRQRLRRPRPAPGVDATWRPAAPCPPPPPTEEPRCSISCATSASPPAASPASPT